MPPRADHRFRAENQSGQLAPIAVGLVNSILMSAPLTMSATSKTCPRLFSTTLLLGRSPKLLLMQILRVPVSSSINPLY